MEVKEGYRLRPNQERYREIKDLETEIRFRRLRFYGHMVRMDQRRLNKRVFDGIREYNSVGEYAKQMREETEELKITDNNRQKNCMDREQYGKKSRFLWKIKKNRRVLTA